MDEPKDDQKTDPWTVSMLKDMDGELNDLHKHMEVSKTAESFDSGMLAGLLSSRGIDPGLVAMMKDNDSFGGNGLLFLLFLVLLTGGGWNNGGMNGVDRTVINEGNFNQLMTAVNSALAQMDKSLALSNGSITSAIQSCCCNVRTELQAQGNAVQLAIEREHNATQALMAQMGYNMTAEGTRNTQQIVGAINGLQASMLDQFCQIKNREDAKTIQELRDRLAEQRDAANREIILTAIRNKDTLGFTGTVADGAFSGTGSLS